MAPDRPSYHAVMVLAPAGNGEATKVMSALERGLLGRGVKLISSGITGRVVLEDTEGGKKTEGATPLTDLERALVLARKSNTDALLQVVELDWVRSTRFFYKSTSGAFEEVRSREEYENIGGMQQKFSITSPRLVFVGKLIDVGTGEIVGSIDLSRAVADASAPTTYASTSPDIASDSSVTREEIATEIVDRLAELIAKGTGAPSPPPAK